MRRVISRKRLKSYVSIAADIAQSRVAALCQGFTLSLEQIMASLSALELALHQTQRLPRREDGFSCLLAVSAICGIIAGAMTYPAARHICNTTGSIEGRWIDWL
jgi:hypothetical protein